MPTRRTNFNGKNARAPGMGMVIEQRMEMSLHQVQRIIQFQSLLQLSGEAYTKQVRQTLQENPFLHWNTGARRHVEGIDFSRNSEIGAWYNRQLETITARESLGAGVLAQLRCSGLSARELFVAETLVANLNAKGFLGATLEEIADEHGFSEGEVSAALCRLQACEPAGVGARDVIESLLLQARRIYPGDHALARFIQTELRTHLHTIKEGRLDEVAGDIGMDKQALEGFMERIRALTLFPGEDYAPAEDRMVVPDIVVREVDGTYQAALCDDGLELCPDTGLFQQITGQKLSREEKKRMKRLFLGACQFAALATLRKQAVLEIAQAILDVQAPFMRHGASEIRPLTQKEIARKLEIHESTVSRTVNGRYMLCPQGVVEMRHLFTPGLKTTDGGTIATVIVQRELKKLIEQEDKENPRSDQNLCDLLQAQNICLARRTVAKYRESLGIPHAQGRRARATVKTVWNPAA